MPGPQRRVVSIGAGLTLPEPAKRAVVQLEKAAQANSDRATKLENSLFAGAVVVAVKLANGVTLTVPHGLGRTPKVILQSLLRTAGVTAGTIVEVAPFRDYKNVYVQANGFGATITLDLVIA